MTAEEHPLTSNAWRQLEEYPAYTEIGRACLQSLVDVCGRYLIVGSYVTVSPCIDDAILVEWHITKSVRFGFTLEPDPINTGWYFVSERVHGFGPLHEPFAPTQGIWTPCLIN